MYEPVIHNPQTISEIEESVDPQFEKAKRFTAALMKEGPKVLIENAQTEIRFLTIGGIAMPCSFTTRAKENTHVCSPATFFGGFPKEKVATIDRKILRTLLLQTTEIWEKLLWMGKVDKIALINNWLLSTNLYPPLNEEMIDKIVTHFVSHYPRYAIGFRSINERENPELVRILKSRGFSLIPSRPIFLIDGKEEEHYASRMFKSDLKLLEKSSYPVVTEEDLGEKDFKRIAEIYRQLYVDKHSRYSPLITPRFIEVTAKEKILHYRCLKKEGRVDAAMAFYEMNGVMTSPLFGYDTSLPQELGLYRCISALLSLEAKKSGALLNMSAGASSYKSLRRGKLEIEYLAVYTKHLNLPRRLPWSLLGKLLCNLGTPLMKSGAV